MPVKAVGSTTKQIVRHRGTPRANDASRRSAGTSLSISSAARTTVGIIRIDSASAPANPEKLKPSSSSQNARMNRPATIEGRPVMTSTKKLMTLASLLSRPYSTR